MESEWRRHSSAPCPFIFRSSVACQWSLYLVHIRKMRQRLLMLATAAAAAACVMYASVNGPTVTEHSSVGRSTSPGPPTDRRDPTRRRWRPPTDAAEAAVDRPSNGSTRPSAPGPAVAGRRSSGRGRALFRLLHDTLNEATKQPFPTTSGIYSTTRSPSQSTRQSSLTKLEFQAPFWNSSNVFVCK